MRGFIHRDTFRRVMRALVLMTMVLMGCTEAQPCRNCPSVEGTYAMTWPDGGGMVTEGCALEGPRPPTLTLTHRDSNVTTTIGNSTIGGTLYDTYDFSLSGGGDGFTYKLRALAVPEGGGGDAGMSLRGSLTSGQVDATTGEYCEVSDSFTAQRFSR